MLLLNLFCISWGQDAHCILAVYVFSPSDHMHNRSKIDICWINEYMNITAESLWSSCLIWTFSNTFLPTSSYWLLFDSGQARCGGSASWSLGIFWLAVRWSIWVICLLLRLLLSSLSIWASCHIVLNLFASGLQPPGVSLCSWIVKMPFCETSVCATGKAGEDLVMMSWAAFQ